MPVSSAKHDIIKRGELHEPSIWTSLSYMPEKQIKSYCQHLRESIDWNSSDRNKHIVYKIALEIARLYDPSFETVYNCPA